MNSDQLVQRVETSLASSSTWFQAQIDEHLVAMVSPIIVEGAIGLHDEQNLFDIKIDGEGQPRITQYNLKQVIVGLSGILPSLQFNPLSAYLALVGLWALNDARTEIGQSAALMVWILFQQTNRKLANAQLERAFVAEYKQQFNSEPPTGEFATSCASLERMNALRIQGTDVVLNELCLVRFS